MSGSKLSDASSLQGGPEPVAILDQPLGLTVHAMPSLDEVVPADARRTRTGRLKMLGVLLVCAAPVIASYFTYYVIRPEGRRNFGELIEPSRPLPDVAATSLAGPAQPLRALKGQWLLLSVAGGACDATCQHHLYLQRQLRESLGKDKDRLDWVWLVDDAAPVSEALRPALASATVLRVPATALVAWLAPAAGHRLADHLYVVDPMGSWMMRFPAMAGAATPGARPPPDREAPVPSIGPVAGMAAPAASKAKRDLERLLRASASWDSAGR